MRTLIMIPAYNKDANIQKVVDNIIKEYPYYDYIIINDGSTDRTEEICKREKYNVLNLPINLGIGGAVQAGYRYAKKYHYDIAIQIDGDGQHDIAYAEKMIRIIENGEADIVIGSRFLENKGFQSSGTRRLGIRFLSRLIKVCTQVSIKDVTSGFRVVNKKYIDIYSGDYSNDYPEPEAIVSAVMYGGTIREFPVEMRERQGGESSIRLWNAIYYMIKVTLAIIIRRISYGIRRK